MGNRNNALYKLGASLRDQGIGETALQAALLAENDARFSPPLDDREVLAVAASIMARVTPTRDAAAGQTFVDAVTGAREVANTNPGLFTTSGAVTPRDHAVLAAINAPISENPTDAVLTDALAMFEPPARVARRLDHVAMTERPIIRTYATPSETVNRHLKGGIRTRAVVAIAAPPAVGKTAFVVDLAIHFTAVAPCLYVSTELEAHEIVSRHVGNILNVPWVDVDEGKIAQARIVEALKERPLYVIGCDEIPMDGIDALNMIAREIEGIRQAHDVSPIVIVDYLQDLVRDGTTDGVKGRVGNLATKFRIIAQQCDCAVILVSSVSRAHYGAANKTNGRISNDPTSYMAAAKESGDVEYACAVVIVLDPDATDPETKTESKPVRLVLAKVRKGFVGFAGMRFYGATGRWSEDAAVLVEMTAEAREQKTFEKSTAGDEKAIIERVTNNTKSGEFVSLTTLSKSCGINVQRCAKMIKVLIDAGKLKLATVDVPTAIPGKTRKETDRVVLASWGPPLPPPAAAPTGIFATLMKYTKTE